MADSITPLVFPVAPSYRLSFLRIGHFFPEQVECHLKFLFMVFSHNVLRMIIHKSELVSECNKGTFQDS